MEHPGVTPSPHLKKIKLSHDGTERPAAACGAVIDATKSVGGFAMSSCSCFTCLPCQSASRDDRSVATTPACSSGKDGELRAELDLTSGTNGPNTVKPGDDGAADAATTTRGASASATMATRAPGAAVQRRIDYLEWDDYFMAVAFLSAQRSKDPSTQVGACIVNTTNRIVGIGYNGFPTGCDDDDAGWLETKYPYVCHAEMNAILNKNTASVEGCRIYVALYPCNECAKLIIQSGIREVVYLSDKYHGQKAFAASRRLLSLARVATRQFAPRRPRIVLDMAAMMDPVAVVPPPSEPAAAAAAAAAPRAAADAAEATADAAEEPLPLPVMSQ